jgi:serine/threonine protein kinase/sugar lactone lactonase YvrE
VALAVGSRIGQYEVVSAIGAGGMGEVYRARDSRLGRDVALKILPDHFAADPERRARFDHEARTVAALNHPNIVTIYSVEESGGTRFLTMEIVEGQTIDALIPPRGLSLPELLKYALPIVDAVSAAHDRHIVHRDLKPSNVMVTRDGRVKVLDFGLAKFQHAPTLDEAAPTQSAGLVTSIGHVVGTSAYMSPEQAEGRRVDHRSDVFSLGILLYEMATGVRPFTGDTTLAVLLAIVKDAPKPITEVRSGTSHDLARIIDRCLEKDPERRLQSARELCELLGALAAPLPSSRPTAWRVPILLAVAAVVGVSGGALLLTRTSDGAAGNLPKPTFTRLTFESRVESWPSLSPDGTELVYVGQSAGNNDIYIRPIGGATASADNLTADSPASDSMPSFSPDGRWIAFSSLRENSAGIFVMGRRGELIRRLTNVGADPTWTPDGREIIYSTESGGDAEVRRVPSELWAVNVDSGARRRISEADAVQPRVSPDSRFVAFWALPLEKGHSQFASPDRDIWVLPMAGGERVQITSGGSTNWSPAWSRDGRFLYFASDRAGSMNIWRVPIDGQTGRAAGEPVAMMAPALYAGVMSVAADGSVVYAAHDFSTNVRSIPFDPIKGVVTGDAADVVTSQRGWVDLDVSPDGRQIAMRSIRAQEDIWVVGTDGSGLRPLTNDPARDRGPRWAPDGSLMYYSSRSGQYQFWAIGADGSGLRQITHGDLALNHPIPSPDGRWVAGSNPNGGDLFIFDARDWRKAHERLPQPPGRGTTYLWDWSPDGTKIATRDTVGQLRVFTVATKTWESVGTGVFPRWLPDGRHLVAQDRGRMTLVDTVAKTSRQLYAEPDRGRAIFLIALAPDARRVYFTSAVSEADIWLMRFEEKAGR